MSELLEKKVKTEEGKIRRHIALKSRKRANADENIKSGNEKRG